MPPAPMIDLTQVDLTRIELTRQQIYDQLPQRFEFEVLDGIHCVDLESNLLIAWSDVRPDAWWCRGHLPGRPLLPGVLMIEMAAQAAAMFWKSAVKTDSFIGFGGVEECKFRDAVVPPAKLHFIVKALDIRPKRVVAACQGLIKGRVVFEAKVTGLLMA